MLQMTPARSAEEGPAAYWDQKSGLQTEGSGLPMMPFPPLRGPLRLLAPFAVKPSGRPSRCLRVWYVESGQLQRFDTLWTVAGFLGYADLATGESGPCLEAGPRHGDRPSRGEVELAAVA